MAYFTLNGKKIWYTMEGKGDPLLFFHEWNSSSVPFLKTCGADMKAFFTVITFDFPGCGKSEMMEDLTFESLCGLVEKLITYLGFSSVYITAFCQGTAFAMDFAIRRPSRVKQLCLIEPTFTFPLMLRLLLHKVIGPFFYRLFCNKKGFFNLFLKVSGSSGLKFYRSLLQKTYKDAEYSVSYRYLTLLKEYSALDHIPRLRQIVQNTKIIFGEKTFGFVKRSAQIIGRHIPYSVLKKISRGGHFLLHQCRKGISHEIAEGCNNQ